MTNAEVEIMLKELKLAGMAQCFSELSKVQHKENISQTELVGKLCIAQREHNFDRRIQNLRRRAKFRFPAQPEDIVWSRERGLDRSKHIELLHPDWIKRKENLIINGCSGTGKTWLACAIGNALIRNNFSSLYFRTKNLLESINTARLDGTLGRVRKGLTRPELLILDDFGISPYSQQQTEDLFEIIESRTEEGSILIAGQLSTEEWHAYLCSGHLADAIMDRLIQNSHQILLKGDSRRKRISGS